MEDRPQDRKNKNISTNEEFLLLLSKSRRNEIFLFNSNFSLEMSLRRVFKGKGPRAQRTRMPTQTTENDDIRVKIVYNGEVQITYVTAGITVDTLREEMRTICGFGAARSGTEPDQFTMKWVDDEGDPCRITSQHELDEALRLYEIEKDTEITIHESVAESVVVAFWYRFLVPQTYVTLRDRIPSRFSITRLKIIPVKFIPLADGAMYFMKLG